MPKVLLGDVAVEHKETCKGSRDGFPVVGLEHLIPEDINLTQWSESTENTFTRMFRKGNVLFGRRRAYLKKAAMAPFDGICSGDITVIEAKPDMILPELLPFVIQNDSLFDYAVGKSAGSLSPRVKWEHLKNFEFELPEMDEQRRLAQLLWAMDAAKQAYKKLLSKTDELVKSQFCELFGGGADSVKGNSEIDLGELCSIGSSKRVYQSEQSAEGIPFLRVSDLIKRIETNSQDADLHIPESKFNELKDQGLVPKAGDILITSRGTIGKCYIVQEGDAFYFQDGMISWLSNMDKRVLAIYIYYLFQMPEFRKQIDDIQAGSTVAYLSITMLKKLKVMVPDMEHQKQFAAFVRQSDKSKFELEQSIAELDATYKKIISDYLG